MHDHPQVHIKHGDQEADVDEGIAALILELWKADIDTVMSCQDNNGRMWVELASAGDAERFLDIVAGDYDEDVHSLYNRMLGEWEDEDWEAFRAEHKWRYDCSPVDYHGALYELDGELVRPAGEDRYVMLHVSVRFPRYDYDEVLRRLQVHNAQAQHDA